MQVNKGLVGRGKGLVLDKDPDNNSNNNNHNSHNHKQALGVGEEEALIKAEISVAAGEVVVGAEAEQGEAAATGKRGIHCEAQYNAKAMAPPS